MEILEIRICLLARVPSLLDLRSVKKEKHTAELLVEWHFHHPDGP